MSKEETKKEMLKAYKNIQMYLICHHRASANQIEEDMGYTKAKISKALQYGRRNTDEIKGTVLCSPYGYFRADDYDDAIAWALHYEKYATSLLKTVNNIMTMLENECPEKLHDAREKLKENIDSDEVNLDPWSVFKSLT